LEGDVEAGLQRKANMNTNVFKTISLTVLALRLSAGGVHAAETPRLSDVELARKVEEKLHYQQGDVTLPGGIAKLNLTPEFRYLNPDDAQFVLVDLWRNPPGPKTLGMIFPADVGPLSSNGWAVVVTFSDDGYIKDSDADTMDYTKLLRDMKKGVAANNKERVAQGFPALELVGWATPPHYDKQTHKMYWAKELKFGDSTERTLNYNIRILGRRGVLNLNAVASMDALPTIEASAGDIVKLANFTEGNRYADFQQGTDKVAAYGLAALVAGGVAAKAGLFKVLLGFLIAAKKFLIIGVIALIALVKKVFPGRKNSSAAPES
jgi:uncharacterized membrane-anchored protein